MVQNCWDYHNPHMILAEEMLVPTVLNYHPMALILKHYLKEHFISHNGKNEINMLDIPIWIASLLDSSDLIIINLPICYHKLSKRKPEGASLFGEFQPRDPVLLFDGIYNNLLSITEYEEELLTVYLINLHQKV